MPPIAGLQDIWAILSSSMVSSRTRAPMRAAASAASQPAWPPPTTTMSNSMTAPRLLADAELPEDPVQDVLRRRGAGDLAEGLDRGPQVHGHELAGQARGDA